MEKAMEMTECVDTNEDSLKKRLMKNCKYPISRVIVVWCPSAEIEPSFIASLLGSYDHEVVLNNHWVSSSSSSLKVWSGVLAEYNSKKVSKFAADNIQKKCRSLKVLFFQEIIDILVQAEFHYRKSANETTKIVLKARNPFQEEHLPQLTTELSQFGKPKKIQLYRKRTRSGVIATIEYTSQFQAYATKIAMDGSLYDCLGFISVEISLTASGKKFDKFVRNRFRSIADSC